MIAHVICLECRRALVVTEELLAAFTIEQLVSIAPIDHHCDDLSGFEVIWEHRAVS